MSASKKLIVELPAETHKALKVKAAQDETTLRQLVETAIHRSLTPGGLVCDHAAPQRD